MTMENFYEAAVRHWIDGGILEANGEYDNAVCMAGFAAECALKAMLETGYAVHKIRKAYGHRGNEIMQDITVMLQGDMQLATVLDPEYGLRLSGIILPGALFSDHPDRRYRQDYIYSREDAESCLNAAYALIKEMASMRIDGYL